MLKHAIFTNAARNKFIMIISNHNTGKPTIQITEDKSQATVIQLYEIIKETSTFGNIAWEIIEVDQEYRNNPGWQD